MKNYKLEALANAPRFRAVKFNFSSNWIPRQYPRLPASHQFFTSGCRRFQNGLTTLAIFEDAPYCFQNGLTTPAIFEDAPYRFQNGLTTLTIFEDAPYRQRPTLANGIHSPMASTHQRPPLASGNCANIQVQEIFGSTILTKKSKMASTAKSIKSLHSISTQIQNCQPRLHPLAALIAIPAHI